MPKMKTKKAASKRFIARGSGSIKRAHATQASHPDQAHHQKQASTPRHADCPSFGCEARSRHDALRIRRLNHASRKTWCYGSRPHKKVLALAKGFRGRRGNVFRIAKQAVMKAGQYAYRDRRNKKRVFRQLWMPVSTPVCVNWV